MKNKDTKIIGYFAFRAGTMYAFCDGDACVIAGFRKGIEILYHKARQGRNQRLYRVRIYIGLFPHFYVI